MDRISDDSYWEKSHKEDGGLCYSDKFYKQYDDHNIWDNIIDVIWWCFLQKTSFRRNMSVINQNNFRINYF